MLPDWFYVVILISFCYVACCLIFYSVRFVMWLIRQRSAYVTPRLRSQVELPASPVTESAASHLRKSQHDKRA
jgi:hypothetical protein